MTSKSRAGRYTRTVRGWALSLHIDQQLTRDALDMALTHGKPTIFHSDQGSQYAAWLHTNLLLKHRIQISMSDKPEALISLDRKIRSHREDLLRKNPELQLPHIWLIPLFEDIETVRELESYLNRLWEYCIQSRRIDQEISERFAEMVCEIFIAGSLR